MAKIQKPVFLVCQPFLLQNYVCKIRLILFLVLTTISCHAIADNLLEAYRQAYFSDHALKQAQAELLAKLQDKPLARSTLFPHLGVGASMGESKANITGFGNPVSEGYPTKNYSVNLVQPIFDGQALAALNQASSRIQAAESALSYTEQQLALNVTTAYFGVLQAYAQNRVMEEQEKLLNSIFRQAEANLQVGTGDIIAVREARSGLDVANADLIKSRNALAVAQHALERLTHHSIGNLDDLGYFKALGPQPDKLQPWVSMAIKSQPLIHQAKAQLRTAQEQVIYERRKRWPKVNLQAFASHSLGFPFPGVIFNQVGVSVNLSMSVYEGGSISASVEQSQAQVLAMADHLGSLRDEITLNTQTAFLNLENSVAELKAANESVASAKISLDATRKGYEVGVRSIIDLLSTATDYIRARQNYNLARYSQVMARIQLKAAAGVLNMTDLESVNAMLDKEVKMNRLAPSPVFTSEEQ